MGRKLKRMTANDQLEPTVFAIYGGAEECRSGHASLGTVKTHQSRYLAVGRPPEEGPRWSQSVARHPESPYHHFPVNVPVIGNVINITAETTGP